MLIGNEMKVSNAEDGTEYAYGCNVVWSPNDNIVHYAIIGDIIDTRIYFLVDRIQGVIEEQKKNVRVFSGNAFISRNKSEFIDAVFSKKIYLVCHSIVDPDGIISHLSGCGYRIEINDDLYYREKVASRDIDIFISHDSRDKEPFVREVDAEISRRLIRTWLDEKVLLIGDRLTTNINDGLTRAKYCLVVLSKNFLENKGWCDREFRSIVTREIHEKRNILMPVWHGVTKQDIMGYSLELADRVAMDSRIGPAAIAEKIRHKVYQSL